MKGESGRVTLRYTLWVRGLMLVIAVFLIWGTVTELSRGTLFTKATWGVVGLAGLVGVAETLIGRVELHANSLVIVGPFGRKVLPRAGIERLTPVRKVGVFLELTDGKPLKLETIGFMGQQAIPTVRAWLRRTRTSEEEAACRRTSG